MNAENTVVLPKDLVDEFEELFSRNDKETTNQQDSEEEEIQVFEPPPKTPPLCINLDDTPTLPSPSHSLDAKDSAQQESFSDLKDNTSNFVEREFDTLHSAASRPAVAPTIDAVFVSQALLDRPPPPLSEATTMASQMPCSVPLSSHDISCPVMINSNQLSLQPLPLEESNRASTIADVSSISTKVSAKKLDKKIRIQKRKETQEKAAHEQNQSTNKDKAKSKKPKKEDTKKSPVQSASVKLPSDLDKQGNGSSRNIQPFPESSERRSALNSLLTDFETKAQQGKDRLALIDRNIEELQLARKALSDNIEELQL